MNLVLKSRTIYHLGKKFNPQKQSSGSSIRSKYAQQKLTFFFYTLTKPDNTRRQPEFTQSCIFQQ